MATQHAPLYAVEADFTYSFDGEGGDIVAFMDSVVDHINESLDADDVFVVLNEDNQSFTISCVVTSPDGESIETVVGKGMGLFRTAFHACNGSTPDWPTLNEALRSVRATLAEQPKMDLIDA